MVATPTLVSGAVKEGFERVRDAFEQNFTAHDEVGAAVCVYVDGRMVVDLWGGTADADAGRPWQRDTLMLIRSTTKGAAAICAAMLAERGELDVEAPVVDTWPEFGAQGKEEVPVAWVLCHRVGLPALDAWIGRDEAVAWDPVVEALAAQRPVWQPGTRHGYHALTYGFLVGEIVRRVTGRTLGRYFHDEVAQPLGLDFWIGLPNHAVARVAHMVPPAMPSGFDPATLPKQERNFIAAARDPATLTSRALSMTRPALDDNDPVVWSAELPAHNGIATARSIARMYAATIGEVDGTRLLNAETMTAATVTRSDGTDEILRRRTRFGLGFALESPFARYRSTSAFGHPGAGGSMGFADPEHGIAFGYVMNRMWPSVLGPDPRTAGLLEAVRASCA